MQAMLLSLLWILSLSHQKALATDSEALSQRCLKAHNEYRTRHGAPPLKWSGELAEEAQNWANHLAAIDQMERDPTTQEGENIFYMYGGDPSEACDRAVENWYSEVKNYDVKNPQESQNTDHFSQIVWKKTRELGVGTAKSKSGNFFLVARYTPKGNADVTLTVTSKNPQEMYTAKDKPEEPVTSQNKTPPKPKDNAISEPVIAMTTTEGPDPSVPMATGTESQQKPSDSGSSQKPLSSSSSPSLPTIIKNNDNKIKTVDKDTTTEVDVSKPVENYDKNYSKHGRQGDKSLESQLKADPTAEMKVKPPQFGKEFRVELRFPKFQYTDKMAFPSSKDYDQFRIDVTSAIMQLYEDDENFQEVQLLSLRNGSVIATLGLIFANEGPGHLDKLTSAVAIGKLGELDISRDYVAAGALPKGYLKLTRPRQAPMQGTCPQPCSNPTHCFPLGCHVTCCSFRPTPATTVHHHHSLTPIQPPPPSCPGNCDSSCLPQCTGQCCWNKQPAVQQDAMQQTQTLEVSQPEANHLEGKQPEASYSNQGYSCPATCPFACYPQCTPECCTAPSYSMTQDCSDGCADFCSVDCPQECCGSRKSNIHKVKHIRRPMLPVSLRVPKLTYRSTNGALRYPLYYGKGFKHVSNQIRYDLKNLQTYLKRISMAYGKDPPHNVGMQKIPFGPKGGSFRNTLRFQQKNMYQLPGKVINKKLPAQRLQATKKFNSPKFTKTRYSWRNNPGLQAINDLQSKGAPVHIRFAYRYGNRLLVPIDMPNMDIKVLQGKKFISVPAFKRTMKEGRSSKQ